MSNFDTQKEVLNAFALDGEVVSCDAFGNGHINDTFCVVCSGKEGQKRYILQKMNNDIFKQPEALMNNIEYVTDFLKKEIEKNHGDIDRETMHIIKTTTGKNYFVDSLGGYWRMFTFVEDAISLEKVEQPNDFYESAFAFGKFQRLLANFDASLLVETIPNFHNTPVRFEAFKEAVEKDICSRADGVREEIAFFLAHEEDMRICQEKLEQGLLPLRVTHNDTKLNNVLMDVKTRKGLCVVDLDTVMPGLSIFDFGDSIRFGANTGAEDEVDLTKVSIDLELYEIYAKGYLEGCGGRLTEEEIRMMPYGAKNMTLECGMRFLTDYLQGDTYFKIHRENHNLDRTRTHIKLVKDMETKWDRMLELTLKAAGI